MSFITNLLSVFFFGGGCKNVLREMLKDVCFLRIKLWNCFFFSRPYSLESKELRSSIEGKPIFFFVEIEQCACVWTTNHSLTGWKERTLRH